MLLLTITYTYILNKSSFVACASCNKNGHCSRTVKADRDIEIKELILIYNDRVFKFQVFTLVEKITSIIGVHSLCMAKISRLCISSH